MPLQDEVDRPVICWYRSRITNGWMSLGNLLTVCAIPFAFRETAVSVLEVDDAYNSYTKAIILEKKTGIFTSEVWGPD